MKKIILGTAGHIDHGKTSLIKKITGVNTDRLKEEQKRGITIDLGFTSLNFENGDNIGIIDVPGHEKFIKNMVAGATSIDIVLLVIAADEGVMPQTIEHIDICSLLDIKYGIIALTKTDLVEQEWIELVKNDVYNFSKNTFLRNSPIIEVSSKTGTGINNLINEIKKTCNNIPNKKIFEIFRLPIDRVFTMKGFGTIATGTIISGSISTGESVVIYPEEITSKVRGIQVHNRYVQSAFTGMRTAINLQGLKKNEISRGNVLSIRKKLFKSYMVDVSLQYLKNSKKVMKNRSKIRFHSGTSEIIGILILLDKNKANPGEKCIAQIHLDTPVTLVRNDSFVIRSYSPIKTIAGGKILNPFPKKRKPFKNNKQNNLKMLKSKKIPETISYQIKLSETTGITFNKLLVSTGLSKKKLEDELTRKISNNKIIKINKNEKIYIDQLYVKKISNEILSFLKGYHKENPLSLGVQKELIISQINFTNNINLTNSVLKELENSKKISVKKELIHLKNHLILFKNSQNELKNKITKIYKNYKLAPPFSKQLLKEIKITQEKAEPIINFLINEKTLIKVKEDLLFHESAINMVKKNLINFLEKNKEISTSDFKKMIQTSRKYAIPLIEYYDSIKLTIRIQNKRKLRKRNGT